jgi:predicted nucleic acid-binding protein
LGSQGKLLEDLERLLISINHRIIPFDTEAAHEAGVLMASRRLKGARKSYATR